MALQADGYFIALTYKSSEVTNFQQRLSVLGNEELSTILDSPIERLPTGATARPKGAADGHKAPV